jgi:GTP-binding protein
LKVRTVEFIKSAVRPGDHPAAGPPEVAFLGRSNVGKSSLLNRLVGRRGVARVSRTPGRTQQVNYFLVNERLFLVDLPGYGFARVPRKIRAGWEAMMQGYLGRRERIALAVLLVDARRPDTPLDRDAAEWLARAGLPALVVMTKYDKLRAHERVRARKKAQAALSICTERPPIGFSAVAGTGLAELWRAIDEAVGEAQATAETGKT